MSSTADVQAAPFDERSWEALGPPLGDGPLSTGVTTVRGHRVAAAVFCFEHRAGTIGAAEVDGFVALVRRAIGERLPLVALVRSGGVRMQEGAEPFTRLAAIARSLSDLRAAGLPFVAHMGHPATGGALVAIASMAQVRWAEPGALMTMVGPRAGGRDMRSERLVELGQIDALVPTDRLADALGDLLDVLSRRTVPLPAGSAGHDEHGEVGAASSPGAGPLVGWEAVVASREPTYQTLHRVLDLAGSPTVLRGDRTMADDESLLACIGQLGGRSCLLVAGSLAADRNVGAAALRKGARAFALAGELGLPIVTLVDVAGPHAASDADWAALPGAVASCIEVLHRVPVPSVGVMLGAGSGAAALGLLSTRTIVAVESSWVAPLSPEQAALILYGDEAEAAAAADRQRLSSTELLGVGWLDEVVADDAAAVVDAISRRLPA